MILAFIGPRRGQGGYTVDFLIMAVATVVLYFLSDGILKHIEKFRGTPFKERSVVFFGIFLSSMLIVFLILEKLF